MKIAIVDDDAQDTNRLAAFLAEWSEEHHLDFSVTVFHKSSDFLKAFETARYSLVFMDIYMGPPSGIETAMKLREKDSRFLVVNRGVLVNLDYVESMDGLTCLMKDKRTFPLNTRKHGQLEQALIEHRFRRRKEELRRRTRI